MECGPKRTISSSQLEQWHDHLKTHGYVKCPIKGCEIMFHRSCDLENHYISCSGKDSLITFMCSKCYALLPSSDYISLHNSVLHQVGLVSTSNQQLSSRSESEFPLQFLRENSSGRGKSHSHLSEVMKFCRNPISKKLSVSTSPFMALGNRSQSEIHEQNLSINSSDAEFHGEPSETHEESFQPIVNYLGETYKYNSTDKEVLHSRSESVSSDPLLVDESLPGFMPNLNANLNRVTSSRNKDFYIYKHWQNGPKSSSHCIGNLDSQINDVNAEEVADLQVMKSENNTSQYVRKGGSGNNIYLINTNAFTSGNSVSFRQRESNISGGRKHSSSPKQQMILNQGRESNANFSTKNYMPKNIYNLEKDRQLVMHSPVRRGFETDECEIDDINKVTKFPTCNFNRPLGNENAAELFPVKEKFMSVSHNRYLNEPSTSYFQLLDNRKKHKAIHCKDVGKQSHPEAIYLKKCELAEKAEHLDRVEQAVKYKEEKAQESIWLALREQQAALREQQSALNEQQAALKEREQNLLKRELLAQKKFEQVNILLEETKKLKTLNHVNHNLDNLVGLRKGFQNDPLKLAIDNSLKAEENLQPVISFNSQHIQSGSSNASNVILEPGLIFPSHKVQIVPVAPESKPETKKSSEFNLNASSAKSRRGRKANKIVLPDGFQEVLPSIEPSDIKRTYSRIPKRHSFVEINESSNIDSLSNKFSKQFLVGNTCSIKDKGKTLKNDAETITVLQISKQHSQLHNLASDVYKNCYPSEMKLENIESPLLLSDLDVQEIWSSNTDNSHPLSDNSSTVEKVGKLTTVANMKKMNSNLPDCVIPRKDYCDDAHKCNLNSNIPNDSLTKFNGITSTALKNKMSVVSLEGVSLPGEICNSVHPFESLRGSHTGQIVENLADKNLNQCLNNQESSLLIVPKLNEYRQTNSLCNKGNNVIEGTINYVTQLESIPCDIQIEKQGNLMAYAAKDSSAESSVDGTNRAYLIIPNNRIMANPNSPRFNAQVSSTHSFSNNFNCAEEENLLDSQISDSLCQEYSTNNAGETVHEYVNKNIADIDENVDQLTDSRDKRNSVETACGNTSISQKGDTLIQKAIDANISSSSISSEHDFSSFGSFLSSEVSDESPSKVSYQNTSFQKTAENILLNSIISNTFTDSLSAEEIADVSKDLNTSRCLKNTEVNNSYSNIQKTLLPPDESNNQFRYKCIEQNIFSNPSLFPAAQNHHSFSEVQCEHPNSVPANEEPLAILPLEIEINSEINNSNLDDNLNDNTSSDSILTSNHIRQSFANGNDQNPNRDESLKDNDFGLYCSPRSDTNSSHTAADYIENPSTDGEENEPDEVVNISNSSILCESEVGTSLLQQSKAICSTFNDSCFSNFSDILSNGSNSSIKLISKITSPVKIVPDKNSVSCISKNQTTLKVNSNNKSESDDADEGNSCSLKQNTINLPNFDCQNTPGTIEKVYKKRGRKKIQKTFENLNNSTKTAILGDFICGKCNQRFPSDLEFMSHIYSVHNGLARIKGESQHFLIDEALERISDAYRELKYLSSEKSVRMTCEKCKKAISSLHGFKYHYKNVCGGYQKKNLPAKPPQRAAAKRCKTYIKSFTLDMEDPKDSSSDQCELDSKVKKFYSCCESPIVFDQIKEFQEKFKEKKTAKCVNDGCNVHFTDCRKLKTHLKSCLESSRQFSCNLCSFCSEEESAIVTHILADHSDYLEESEKIGSEDDNYKLEKLTGKRKKNIGYKSFNSPVLKKQKFDSSILYSFSKELTSEFREVNYQDSLFTNLKCLKSSWLQSLCSLPDSYLPLVDKSPKFKQCNSEGKLHQTEKWCQIDRFSSLNLKSGYFIFAGGPIQSAAWCPIPKNVNGQYLALSCQGNFNQKYPISQSVKHESLIQMWKCEELGSLYLPKLSFCIAHCFGLSWCLEWCPSGVYEAMSTNEKYFKRLGLLGGSFSDGSIRIFVIPNPSELMDDANIYKRSPDLSLLPYNSGNNNLQCTKISWCSSKGHTLVAGSFTNGIVCVWDIDVATTDNGGIFKDYSEEDNIILYPINSIKAHHGVCSTVSFCPSTHGQHIVTGGSDRIIRFWDLAQPEQPITVVRKGSVTNSAWLPHWAGAFIAYDDVYGLGKTNTSYRDNGFYGSSFRSILTANACVNNISASDWLNAIAQVDEAGEVLVSFQHSLTCETQNEKQMFKKRFPLFSTKLENIKSGKILSLKDEYNSTKLIDSPSKSPKRMTLEEMEIQPQAINLYPMTYDLAAKDFGVVFCDETMDSFPKIESIEAKQYSHLMDPGPITVYPLMGASCVSWNNNLGAHSWIFVGLKSGLGRIINLSFIDKS